jgi:hypothetical protein
MRFSETEKKLIERLKKRQQSLIRWRWIGLLGALGNIALGIVCLVVLDHFLDKPDLPAAALVAAFLIPTTYILIGAGLGLVVYMILHWNGKPETSLLLKLIEDSRDDSA